MSTLRPGTQRCECGHRCHNGNLIALTGGPGAGKTAVLELASRSFCEHVAILPEAASLVFGGGFPRLSSETARRAAQRAIFHVQHELERLAIDEQRYGVILCDRGTVDCVAYWPGDPDLFWKEVSTSLDAQIKRYAAVIHLRTPPAEGYNHQNALRIETSQEAAGIDDRILSVWETHDRRLIVPSEANFPEKALKALQLVRAQLPECCRAHRVEGGKTR